MNTLLLLWLVVSSYDFSMFFSGKTPDSGVNPSFTVSYIAPINTSINDIRVMFQKEGTSLRPQVINKVLTTLLCAKEYKVDRNNILTIIDYSLPSNQKRLWVFDLYQKKLLFYTYVSHGINSGSLYTDYFSNKNNSKASSLGVYKTEKAYYGREGLSLRLLGLDRSFNDNAANRYVVMHGGWYVEEPFIKRYGRPGRSWGCPALPLAEYRSIINTIKENSWMVLYYPSDEWFNQSRYLNCRRAEMVHSTVLPAQEKKTLYSDSDNRDYIYFADLNHNGSRGEEEPVLAMAANDYEHIFHRKAPLERMLRRQIDKVEYIAISNKEFNQLTQQNNKQDLDTLKLVMPYIIMVRGYYETQMKFVPVGIFKEARQSGSASSGVVPYTVNFEHRSEVHLIPTNRFIRWLGL